MLQGLKIETESLVEEASAALLKLVLLLVQEVVRISLLTPLPLPDASFLKPGKTGISRLLSEVQGGAISPIVFLQNKYKNNVVSIVTVLLLHLNGTYSAIVY